MRDYTQEETQKILGQVQEQQDVEFQLAMARQKIVGDMTGWRNLKDNSKRSKILAGRAKILNLVL